MSFGAFGMALLLYLNYHVKVEHAVAAARDGKLSHNVVSDQLAHTRESFSREWKHVAENFSLRRMINPADDDAKTPFIPPDNATELRNYMQHHSQHASIENRLDRHAGHHAGGGDVGKIYENKGLERALRALAAHPISRKEVNTQNPALEEVLQELQSQEMCASLPLFVSMANVGSPLYWQMIENYIYTLIKFNLLDCAIMVCVSDEGCMKQCRHSGFPCYAYDFKAANPGVDPQNVGVMEQIAYLKLYHIPKALSKGVNVVLLDLDVGFLSNPLPLLQRFMADEHVDAYVQKDVTFIMNRTVAGWKQWWTEPMPNIGLFMIKGNERSVAMFDYAWMDYQHHTKKSIKNNPGKDQNKVVFSMRISERRHGFKWRYIPSSQAVLIDKYFKFADMGIELGGEATQKMFRAARDPTEQFYTGKHREDLHLLAGDDINATSQAVAIHTTCYEQKMKVAGLKAANAFWNPVYYDGNRRTLTKKLMYHSYEQLLREVRGLSYLALRLNRTLIIPNVLAKTKEVKAEIRRSNKGQRPIYAGNTVWPGFRVLYSKGIGNKKNGQPVVPVPTVEPAFYWRIKRDVRDYLSEEGVEPQEAADRADKAVPTPLVVMVSEDSSLGDIETQLQAPGMSGHPRVVVHVLPRGGRRESPLNAEERVVEWAQHSVGLFASYEEETKQYGALPALEGVMGTNLGQPARVANAISNNIRLCGAILEPMRGNRSCFDKCN